MEFSVVRKSQATIDVKYVEIIVPVNYGEEDIPNDFFGRRDDEWRVVIDLERGVIIDWPVGQEASIYMKVVDGGIYRLLDKDMQVVAEISEDYVPHGVVPGEWGDYVQLEILPDGRIENWPKKIDVAEFFKHDE